MKRILPLLILLSLAIGLKAQQTDTSKKAAPKESSADSLMNAMSKNDKPEDVLGAFKSTRLILSPTTQTVKKNNLNFLVIHRFGDLATSSTGAKTFFGLDAVQDVYIGFEYGLSDNLNINLGRSTIGQLIELGLKYAVVHQTNDDSSPIAITLLGDYGLSPYQQFATFSDRNAYLAQAIFSRKFSSKFSFQVSPIFVHDYSPILAVPTPGKDQQFFAASAAARLKVTKHMSLVVDYEHPFSGYRTDHAYSDPLGFGIEVETGGHVFTLNISNARGISEINSLTRTQSDFGRGEFRIGFTISRMFDFNHKESYK